MSSSGPDGTQPRRGHGHADTQVSGLAHGLYLLLWNRQDAASGDLARRGRRQVPARGRVQAPQDPAAAGAQLDQAGAGPLGVVVLVASWLGGQLGGGLYGLAVLTVFGLVLLLLGGRSETIRGLTTGRDERFAQIDLRATAIAGLALITAVIVAWLVEIAHGHSGSPYTWLAALGGLTYILAVAFFRWRG
jgi:hypothetical protein